MIAVFTDRGERVPTFRDRFKLPGVLTVITRYGWKSRRSWTAGFMARRKGSRYEILDVRYMQHQVDGSSQCEVLREWCVRTGEPLPKRFPNIASVEVYLRTIYGAR